MKIINDNDPYALLGLYKVLFGLIAGGAIVVLAVVMASAL